MMRGLLLHRVASSLVVAIFFRFVKIHSLINNTTISYSLHQYLLGTPFFWCLPAYYAPAA